MSQHWVLFSGILFNPSLSSVGSAEATPKSVMRVMGVKGLTLYHLKSHLQVKFNIYNYILIQQSPFGYLCNCQVTHLKYSPNCLLC